MIQLNGLRSEAKCFTCVPLPMLLSARKGKPLYCPITDDMSLQTKRKCYDMPK